jgi:hypothetical protein
VAKAEFIGLSQEILNTCADLDFLQQVRGGKLITLRSKIGKPMAALVEFEFFLTKSEECFLYSSVDLIFQKV